MRLEQTRIFRSTYKKLPDAKKRVVNNAIRDILENPLIGTAKKQDLLGVYVHKFPVDKQQYLLAYTFDPETLKLLLLGVHENFYRDLKRKL